MWAARQARSNRGEGGGVQGDRGISGDIQWLQGWAVWRANLGDLSITSGQISFFTLATRKPARQRGSQHPGLGQEGVSRCPWPVLG